MACVDREGRSALLDLDHVDRPPVILEGSAAEIWQRVDGSRTAQDIAEALVELFGESIEVVGPVVETFLSELEERHLVEQVPGA